MSEREPNEDEPSMKLTRSDYSEYYATRDNTSLFTFLGRAAFNHVFIHTDDNEENIMIGTYVFECHPMFERMSDYMFANDYPLHLNLPEVAECDQKAWENMVHQQVEDFEEIPEDWLGGQSE